MRVAVMKFIGAALLCLVLMPPAFAQTAPPYTPPTQTYSVTTGSGSSASAMPVPAVGGPLPYGLFQNIGSNPISFALGNTNGITVTPGTTIPTIQGGSCQLLFVGNTPGFIALQSVGGSSTLQVTLQYGQGPLPVSCPGASGSGVISGTVTANQGTAAATASAWPVTLAIGGALNSITNPVFVAPSTGATFGVTGTFWQATQPISAVSLPLPTGAMASTGGTVGLVAGSALAGKFGIDQTTPGTTNGVVVNSSALPTGAALDASLQSILTKLNASIAVTGTFWQATQPVSAASLPLPTGAATAANQATVQPIAGTSGGYSFTSTQVANNTTAIVIKNSPGQIGGIRTFNNSATIAYGKIYNAASGITCGTGTVVDRFMIQPNSNGGFIDMMGEAYSAGITVCVTGAYADNDTTNPAASAYEYTVVYK